MLKSLLERLRDNEKIKCESCKKGIYISASSDVKTSDCFVCNVCGSVVQISKNVVIE